MEFNLLIHYFTLRVLIRKHYLYIKHNLTFRIKNT